MAGRIRSIKPEVLEDEHAASLSDAAWRLWVSMWTLADDYGNLRVTPKWLGAQVFWGRQEPPDVGALVAELAAPKADGRPGLIAVYVVNGQSYAHITGWHHQKVDKPGKPRCPGPEQAVTPTCADSSRESRETPEKPRDHSRLTGTGTSTTDRDQEEDRRALPPPLASPVSLGPPDNTPPWKLGDPLTKPMHFAKLAEASGAGFRGQKPVRANITRIEELLPVPVEDYGPAVEGLKARGKTPNVGLICSEVADLRKAGQRTFGGKVERAPPAPRLASQRLVTDEELDELDGYAPDDPRSRQWQKQQNSTA